MKEHSSAFALYLDKRCLSSMRKFLKQMQNEFSDELFCLSLKTQAIEEEVLKIVLLVIRYHDNRQCDGTVLMKTGSVCSKVLCHSTTRLVVRDGPLIFGMEGRNF